MSPEAHTKRKSSGRREAIRTLALALAFALAVRTFLYQPFNIPSGSMEPTLLVGDYLFASKYAYGYSRYSLPFGSIPFDGRLFGANPRRGDVVIFRLPRDTATDYVKRVIGLPGDEVLVRHGIVYVNGQALPQTPADEGGQEKPRYQETLPNGVKHYVLHWNHESELDNVGPFKVPGGHYFVLGDNRDDSIDSRVPASRYAVGYVPYENLIARAGIVFLSIAVGKSRVLRWTRPWTWPQAIRWHRILKPVD
jgi:signal peptidase I